MKEKIKNTINSARENVYNDKDYIHYVYKIVNIVSNKYYIGIHSFPKSNNLTPLNDGYWGSGIEIRKAINSEGRKNFRKEIIGVFKTRAEIVEKEKELVTIELVRDPNCYNMILGGINNDKSFYCINCYVRNTNKLVKISKEEYYNNKDLYVTTGHVNDVKRAEILQQDKKRKRKYMTKQKISDDDTFYARQRKYININTKEERIFIGHEIIPDEFSIWFPFYFFTKTGEFITKDYLIDNYKLVSNINKLSIKFGIGNKSFKKVIKYYEKLDNFNLIEYSSSKIGKINKRGFSGKIYINNNMEELIISKEDFNTYKKLGYKLGKLIKINYDEVYNYYVNGNSIRSCCNKFKISFKIIKKLLNITKDTNEVWFHSDKYQKSIRLFVIDEKMKQDILNNTWIEGKKLYKN